MREDGQLGATPQSNISGKPQWEASLYRRYDSTRANRAGTFLALAVAFARMQYNNTLPLLLAMPLLELHTTQCSDTPGHHMAMLKEMAFPCENIFYENTLGSEDEEDEEDEESEEDEEKEEEEEEEEEEEDNDDYGL